MALSFSVFNKFRAIDGITAPIRKMTKNVGKFGTKTVEAFRRAGKASKRFGKRLKGIGRNLSAKLTLPLTLLGGAAVKAAIDFESAFTGVRKTVNATDKELATLKKELIDMSREIPVATTEIFGIAEAAGQLGIKTKNIAAFTRVIADLKATTNLEEPAKDLARFANIADVASTDFERLGSTIVDLGNNSATTEAEIVEMSLRLAAAGKLVGLSAADTLGLSAALSSVGVRAEAGGTAFSQVMIKINKEIGTGSKKMQGFARVSGKTVGQFEKMWKDDTAGALLAFTEGLKKNQDQGKNVNKVLDGLGFTGIRISDALLRAAGSGDLFRKTIALGNTAWKENTALAKEATLRYGDTAAKLVILWNKVKIVAATFGDVLIPILIKVVDFISPIIEKFEKFSPTTKKIIIAIGAFVTVIGPVLIAAGFLITAISTIIGLPFIGTIAAIGLAIGGLVFAIISVIKNWDFLKDDFKLGLEFLKNIFVNFGKRISDIILLATAFWINKFSSFGKKISEIILLATDFWINKIVNLGEKISNVFSGIGDFIGFDDIKTKFISGLEDLFEIVSGFVQNISEIFSGISEPIKNIFSEIGEFIESIFPGIGAKFKELTNNIINIAKATSGMFLGIFNDIFLNIGNFVEKIFSGIGDKFKKFTSGVGGKIIKLFSFGSKEKSEQQQPEVPISPNAGLAQTIRQETENRSRVSVDFSNLPKGAKVKQTGDVPGFDLDLGFAAP